MGGQKQTANASFGVVSQLPWAPKIHGILPATDVHQLSFALGWASCSMNSAQVRSLRKLTESRPSESPKLKDEVQMAPPVDSCRCLVCFDTCEQLIGGGCGHAFCVSCLTRYAELKFLDGTSRITCA